MDRSLLIFLASGLAIERSFTEGPSCSNTAAAILHVCGLVGTVWLPGARVRLVWSGVWSAGLVWSGMVCVLYPP